LPADGPVKVRSATVTDLLEPALAVSKFGVPVQDTMSPGTAPETVQLVRVALVVPSYALSAAVTVAVT
jgi:hypothetical protein